MIWASILLAASFQYNAYIFLKFWLSQNEFSKAYRAETNFVTAWFCYPPLWCDSFWNTIHASGWHRAFGIILLIIGVLVWWFGVVRDKDKDDRWKKRRKKALAKVKQVGHRLVVVPIPAPSPT